MASAHPDGWLRLCLCRQHRTARRRITLRRHTAPPLPHCPWRHALGCSHTTTPKPPRATQALLSQNPRNSCPIEVRYLDLEADRPMLCGNVATPLRGRDFRCRAPKGGGRRPAAIIQRAWPAVAGPAPHRVQVSCLLARPCPPPKRPLPGCPLCAPRCSPPRPLARIPLPPSFQPRTSSLARPRTHINRSPKVGVVSPHRSLAARQKIRITKIRLPIFPFQDRQQNLKNPFLQCCKVFSPRNGVGWAGTASPLGPSAQPRGAGRGVAWSRWSGRVADYQVESTTSVDSIELGSESAGRGGAGRLR